MKKYIKIYFVTVALFSLFSCQEVVDVDLKTGKQHLVIEALIKWEKGTIGNNQIIKLSKTNSFYNNQIIPATGAIVTVKNLSTLSEYQFLETEDGLYQTNDFEPIINDTYQLTVKYNDEIYQASSTLLEAPEIQSIFQSYEEGFSIDDPEVNIIFQDFIDQPDFYRVTFEYYKPTNTTLDDFELIDHFNFIFNDQFEANNPISIFYENEEFQTNDLVKISIYATTERYFNFLEKLEQQVETGFGPYSLPPINVKGNIINTTNLDNYPYGYFSLNEFSFVDYNFQ